MKKTSIPEIRKANQQIDRILEMVEIQVLSHTLCLNCPWGEIQGFPTTLEMVFEPILTRP